jgi:diguanylate cyclase (GGDEF)-like protein
MSGPTLTIILLAACLAGLFGLLIDNLRRRHADRSHLVQVQRLAMTDELTGLPNRRYWDEQLPRELARAERQGQALFVVMLDLDRFKEFNDSGGHQAGDRFLRSAADAWGEEVRTYDLLARYGGEEFGLVLSGCSAREAIQVVERLRAATPGSETCSAGLAEWNGREASEVLVARADNALYRAKAGGRDQLVAMLAAQPRSSAPHIAA